MAAIFGGIGYLHRRTPPPRHAITKHPRDWTTRDFERLSDVLRENTARDRGRRLLRQEEAYLAAHPPPAPPLAGVDPYAAAWIAEALRTGRSRSRSQSRGRGRGKCCCGCGRRQHRHDGDDEEFREEMRQFKGMMYEVLFGGVMSPREREEKRRAVYEHVMAGRGRRRESPAPPKRRGDRVVMSLEAETRASGGLPSVGDHHHHGTGDYQCPYAAHRYDDESDAGTIRGRDRRGYKDSRDSYDFSWH